MREERIVDVAEAISHGYSGGKCSAVLDMKIMKGCPEAAYDCMKAEKSVWFTNFCEEHLLVAARNRETMRLLDDD